MVDPPVIRWLFGDDEETLYECRECGRTLDGNEDPCPECGSENIAEYRF